MRRSARLATFFRSRTRQLVWAGSLAVLGVALLVGAYGTADFTRDVLINLGASVMMVGQTFVVVDPIFEDVRRNAVQEHRDLNHDQLVAHIAAARGSVDVMETLLGHVADHGIGRIGVQTQRPVTIGCWTGNEFTLARLDAHHEPSPVEVAGQLDRKYGGRHGGVILRLVPQLGGAL